MVQIAGVDVATVVGLREAAAADSAIRWGGSGDGTVALAQALLPGVPAWYVSEVHAQLPCNGDVIRAIIDLVRCGSTRALPQRWRARRESLPCVDDALLGRVGRGKIDWQGLDSRTRMAVLSDLNS